ncbi:MAG: hypothetical protein AAF666_18780 [Pseudomonadota bacterium]
MVNRISSPRRNSTSLYRRALGATQIFVVAIGLTGLLAGHDWTLIDSDQPILTVLKDKGAASRKHSALNAAWAKIDAARTTPLPDQDAARQARDMALIALRESPANGYAWTALAWSELLSGQPRKSTEALRTSWKWTPASRNLALRRVLLAQQLWPRLDRDLRARTVGDLRYARQADPDLFHALLRDDRRLAALWRIARAQRLDSGIQPLTAAPNSG